MPQPTKTAESVRRRLGAWYTPESLVERVLDLVLEPVLDRGPVVVLDPACGDGRFLVAAAKRMAHRFGWTFEASSDWVRGLDLDPEAVRVTNERLGWAGARVADALTEPWPAAPVVVGNPPFLGQLRRRTARAVPGNGYADSAALFWMRAIEQADHVALVLPRSVLATRDSQPVRARTMALGAVHTLWLDDQALFDASVRVCVPVWSRGAVQAEVRRWCGDRPLADAAAPDSRSWSSLIADQSGAPTPQVGPGSMGDLAVAVADFRDQYYGLRDAVADDADGPALVTSGLIDPAICRWGDRPLRFTKRSFSRPRVLLDALSPAMQDWALRRLVPKVMLATQTSILEAVADPDGEWLPSVPVISVLPRQPELLWPVAAALLSPGASTWAAHHSAGAGLGPSAIKLRASQVVEIPLPRQGLEEGAALVKRAHEEPDRRRHWLLEAAHAMAADADTVTWWQDRLR